MVHTEASSGDLETQTYRSNTLITTDDHYTADIVLHTIPSGLGRTKPNWRGTNRATRGSSPQSSLGGEDLQSLLWKILIFWLKMLHFLTAFSVCRRNNDRKLRNTTIYHTFSRWQILFCFLPSSRLHQRSAICTISPAPQTYYRCFAHGPQR